jgi:hypothetical protein
MVMFLREILLLVLKEIRFMSFFEHGYVPSHLLPPFTTQFTILFSSEIWIGDGFCQRKFDDQFAVTAPAAILSPEKAWDMYSNGIRLDVYHNAALDGKRWNKVGGYLKYWKTNVKEQFPEAVHMCDAFIKAGSR